MVAPFAFPRSHSPDLGLLGEVVSEADLADLAGTQAFGTPAPNLHRLEQMEFSVSYESVTLTTVLATLLIRRGETDFRREIRLSPSEPGG